MSRGNTPAFDSETEKPKVRPVRFIEMEFSTTLRLWSGIGDLTWDGKTWTGAGDLLSISDARETTELRANGRSFMLTGIPMDLVSIALSEDYQGRAVRSWFGFLDEDLNVIDSPIRDFKGFMDIIQFSENGDTAEITLDAENSLVAFERANTQNYTAERQKVDYPYDKGFDQVNELQEFSIDWGRG